MKTDEERQAHSSMTALYGGTLAGMFIGTLSVLIEEYGPRLRKTYV